MQAKVTKSDRADKKLKVVVETAKKKKTIHFGAKGMEDFTVHHDNQRKANYIARHKKNEDWSKQGAFTAGFWAKHLLWGAESIPLAKEEVKKKFGIALK